MLESTEATKITLELTEREAHVLCTAWALYVSQTLNVPLQIRECFHHAVERETETHKDEIEAVSARMRVILQTIRQVPASNDASAKLSAN